MRPLINGQARQLQIFAGENASALNIAEQLVRASEMAIPEHISPELQNEIYLDVRRMEEAFIADLESAGAITTERLGVIRSLFGVIQIEMMRSH